MLCANCNETIADPTACPACGQSPLLVGRYRLEGVLGSGALATTFRATRLEDGQALAIKELSLRRVDAAKTLELYDREARVLRQLDHPGIPHYFEQFEGGQGKNQAFYLVQELIEGRTLAEELLEHRPSEPEVLEIIDQVLEILAYLHSRTPPLVHRDIKASNLMRRPDGTLVLIDFGAVGDDSRDPGQGGSTVAGTFGYMAPEQFQGLAAPATDLYAVGVLAVVMLTGLAPEKMIDINHKLQWQPRVSFAHPATINFLKTLLEPRLEERAADATKARIHLARVCALIDGQRELPVRRETRQGEIRRRAGMTSEELARIRAMNQPQSPRAIAARRAAVRASVLIAVLLVVGGIHSSVRWYLTTNLDVLGPLSIVGIRAAPLTERWQDALEQEIQKLRPTVDQCATPYGTVRVQANFLLDQGRIALPTARVLGTSSTAGSSLAACVEGALLSHPGFSKIRLGRIQADLVRVRTRFGLGDDETFEVVAVDPLGLRWRTLGEGAISDAQVGQALSPAIGALSRCWARSLVGSRVEPRAQAEVAFAIDPQGRSSNYRLTLPEWEIPPSRAAKAELERCVAAALGPLDFGKSELPRSAATVLEVQEE